MRRGGSTKTRGRGGGRGGGGGGGRGGGRGGCGGGSGSGKENKAVGDHDEMWEEEDKDKDMEIKEGEEGEEIKIVYTYTYIVVDDDVLYDVVIDACASQDKKCRRLPFDETLGQNWQNGQDGRDKASKSSITALFEAIPAAERAVSLVVLPRPVLAIHEIISAYDKAPLTLPSVHILVEDAEDVKEYYEAWEEATKTRPCKIRKIHAFTPTDHHKAFPVNQVSPRFLEAFRHVWITYFGQRFPKVIPTKRLAEAEGFRQCLFKPCTTADDWRAAIKAVTHCSTNILERNAVRAGVEIVKYIDTQARAVVYHPNSTPIFVAMKGFRDPTALALYNSDIDPFYVACMYNERAEADPTFSELNKSFFSVKYIGTYRMLDDQMTMEVRMCPRDVAKGGRPWMFAYTAVEVAKLTEGLVDPRLLRDEAYADVPDVPFMVPDAVTVHTTGSRLLDGVASCPLSPRLRKSPEPEVLDHLDEDGKTASLTTAALTSGGCQPTAVASPESHEN